MRILFKYATRGRPDWFKETLFNWKSNLSGKHSYRFIISMDSDDETMNNQEMIDYLDNQDVEYYFGDNKSKIEAINADMDDDFDILVVISDDMRPVVFGFDDIIVTDMLSFPFLDGALHYNDGAHCGEKLISITIMGVNLYKEFGYIYYPGYKSMWCDNEFTDIVRAKGKVKWIDRVIIKNEFMKYGSDKIYKKNNEPWNDDKKLYEDRMNLCIAS